MIRFVFISALLLVASCASLPEILSREVTSALAPTANLDFDQAFGQGELLTPEASSARVLSSGVEAFAARAFLADRALQSIDTQYYILHDDYVGRVFLSLLWDAADRGVRVRLLLDDFGNEVQDHDLLALDMHPNIEVRLINPTPRGRPRILDYVGRFGNVTRRMHNKTFIVDNQVMIVGGRNIGNEYFEADGHAQFSDLGVLSTGRVVNDVSGSFDAYWNYELTYPLADLSRLRLSVEERKAVRAKLDEARNSTEGGLYRVAIQSTEFVTELRDGNLPMAVGVAEVIADAPEKLSNPRSHTEFALIDDIAEQFRTAQREITIITPYFLPGDEFVEGLADLVDRGVRVRVLTGSLQTNNHLSVHAHYSKYRQALIEAGVELYELKPDSELSNKATGNSARPIVQLHTKAFIVDRSRIFIGSLNFDPRSFAENTEIGALFHSVELSAGAASWLDGRLPEIAYRIILSDAPSSNRLNWEESIEGVVTTHEHEPGKGFPKSIQLFLFRILPIESQL